MTADPPMPEQPTTSLAKPAPRRRFPSWMVVSVVVLASAQIAIPLSEGQVSGLSVIVILTLGVLTWGFARCSWSLRGALLAFGGVFVGALGIEVLGVHTGFPFGSYSYSSRLQPQVFGVPLIVALAWPALLLPASEIARRISGRWVVQCALTGLAMVAWDVLLDPQMLANGFWAYESRDALQWHGVPLTNFFGWWLSASLLAVVPVRTRTRSEPNNGLAFVWVWMIAFSAFGFLIPIALDDPIVGVAGTLCASPILFLAFRRKDRPWLASPS